MVMLIIIDDIVAFLLVNHQHRFQLDTMSSMITHVCVHRNVTRLSITIMFIDYSIQVNDRHDRHEIDQLAFIDNETLHFSSSALSDDRSLCTVSVATHRYNSNKHTNEDRHEQDYVCVRKE
jgi:hypothetical protein